MSSAAHKPRVAIQGERGAFSEQAALELFIEEKIELVLQKTFTALYDSVAKGEAEYVLAPTWNTILGPVPGSVELLRQTPLLPVSQVRLRINQHLIGCPGATLNDIAVVMSHPAALAQCSRFFKEHPQLKPLEAEDTGGSVAEIMRRGDKTFAAIASQCAAQIYGASVIRSSIQDEEENFTYFTLLALPGTHFNLRQVLKGNKS